MKKNAGKSMKKLLLATILALPVVASASDEPTASPFPNAKPGINIAPLSEINLPSSIKKQMIKTKKAFVEKGYEDTSETDPNVLSLFAVQKNATAEIRQYDGNENPLDTHLKSSLSKLRLSFRFVGIPGIEKKNVLGYAAAGGYTHKNGWDGIVQFVSLPSLGICSFTTYAITKVIMPEESLKYLVNKKPSIRDIAGNWNTGFLYTLQWYNPDRFMALECANKMLKPENMNQMINIAKHIDNGIS